MQDDFSKSIPDLDRKDEIGHLARAAETFKTYSMKLKNEQERAEASTKSKSRFLAMMSHEIRTPMNAILSCTNILMHEDQNPSNMKMLSTIKTSGDSLLVLINDILDFSKIESGKIDLEKTVFSLKECVDSVIDLLEIKANKEGVRLYITEDSQFPEFIKGDVTRLRQVLVNLVANGIKFTKDKVSIKIKSEKKPNNLVDIKFSVFDNGIGIPEDSLEKLFQDFSQVDASTTRKFGGSGLGLAISKGIVESMNGEIGVRSKEGEGSEFFFKIATTEQKAPENSEEFLEDNFDADKGNSHLKVLLVEDNSVNQMVAKKILEKIGIVPDIVSSGLESIEAVQNVTYDLILMDQHMPELDGVEATKKIRNLQIEQPLIYALTASAFLEDKQRCLEAGMDGFLTKPIIVRELKLAITHAAKNNLEIPKGLQSNRQ
tara:strand:- start:305 stop:1597 length:1293 start_codon:yes stop_codon:yes gene_type:complete